MNDDADCVILSDAECRVTLDGAEAIREHGLEHRIEISAGPFRGAIAAVAYENPYARFHDELINLYTNLSGEVRLGPSYENLDMVFRGDGLGHIMVRVTVYADHVRPIRLDFGMTLDQTQLHEIIGQIERAFLAKSPPTFPIPIPA